MATPAVTTTTTIPDWQKTLSDVLGASAALKTPAPAPLSSPAPGALSTPYIPGVTATAPKTTAIPGVGSLTTVPKNPLQPYTAAPNMSTLEGPARGNPDGSITYNTAGGAVTVPKTAGPANSTPYTPATAGPSYIAPPAPKSAAEQQAAAVIDAGLFQRTGVTPPAPTQTGSPTVGTDTSIKPGGTPAGGTPAGGSSSSSSVSGGSSGGTGGGTTGAGAGLSIPTYGTYSAPVSSARQSITDAYNTLTKSITDIEDQLKSSNTKSEDEKRLEQELIAKKAALNTFDKESLQRLENFQGQGRGATLRNIGARQDIERRTSAIERLGVAGDLQNIMDELNLAQDNRKLLGEDAQQRLTLAGKKLDLALGLQDKLTKLDDQEKNDARQFLLDIVSFGAGKTFDQLDPATQAQIVANVANSPITLGMVTTALQNGATKADQTTHNQLIDLGIKAASGGASTKLIQQALDTKDPIKAAALLSQYLKGPTESTAGTGSSTIPGLGKLTPTQTNTLTQAGLSKADTAVQSYFLNTPPAFQDQYQRDIASKSGGTSWDTMAASGKYGSAVPTVDTLHAAYQKWYDEQNKSKSGSHDWSALLGG